jgi:hypothetical protein
MFWLIPIIIGATTAAAAGTSIANTAMDGALFAPEINTYKEEIKADVAVNDGLIQSINAEASRYTSEVSSFNWLMEETNMMRKSFLLADSKATELIMQRILDRNPEVPAMPAIEVAKVQEVLVNGVTVIGGLQMSKVLYSGAAGTQAGAQIGKITAAKMNALKGFGQAAATRVMVAASSMSGVSKTPAALSPLLSAGSKAMTVGLKTGQGVAQALRAGSAALGPLSAIASIALIGLDVAYSQERANQLREHRDLVRRNNDELRRTQSQNGRLIQQFNENRAALLKDEAQSFRYMAKITLVNFADNLPADFPSQLNDIDKIDRLASLEASLVTGLRNFLDNHHQEFVERRLQYHVQMIAYWKQLYQSCPIDARTLVELDPVLGVMGIDFAEYIYRANFIGDDQLQPASTVCELDLTNMQPIDGPTVQAADLVAGRIYQQADQYWIYVDSAKRAHSYREMMRDPWSVYLVSRTDPNKTLQLDMWRHELIDSPWGHRTVIDMVRAGYHFAVPGYEPVTPAPFEYDADRPGLDYRQVDGLDFVECSKVCATDLVCRSFTWTVTANRCYLKDGQPQPVARPGSGFRSGIKI